MRIYIHTYIHVCVCVCMYTRRMFILQYIMKRYLEKKNFLSLPLSLSLSLPPLPSPTR